MISMNPPSPPGPANPDATAIFALLAAVSDSVAHSARVKEQLAARDELQAAKAESDIVLQKVQEATKAGEEKLAGIKAANEAEIQRLRTKLDIDATAVAERSAAVDKAAAQNAARSEALDAREKKIAAREAHLRRAADQIAS
jgi:hypothetical protein